MPGKTFFFPQPVCMAIKSQPDPELRSQQREQAHPLMLLSFQFFTRKRPRPPQGWPFCCRLDGGRVPSPLIRLADFFTLNGAAAASLEFGL